MISSQCAIDNRNRNPYRNNAHTSLEEVKAAYSYSYFDFFFFSFVLLPPGPRLRRSTFAFSYSSACSQDRRPCVCSLSCAYSLSPLPSLPSLDPALGSFFFSLLLLVSLLLLHHTSSPPTVLSRVRGHNVPWLSSPSRNNQDGSYPSVIMTKESTLKLPAGREPSRSICMINVLARRKAVTQKYKYQSLSGNKLVAATTKKDKRDEEKQEERSSSGGGDGAKRMMMLAWSSCQRGIRNLTTLFWLHVATETSPWPF